MIALVLAIAVVLGVLAWRFPRHRAIIGAALVVVVLAAWAWSEFGPARDRVQAVSVATLPAALELEALALEPWHGEHRLRGVAHNRSETVVLTGFAARLDLRNCVDGDCAPLGVHRQRINLRVMPESSVEFERRVRLSPALALRIDGDLEFDLSIEEVHGRSDLHRERAQRTREN